MSLFIIFLIFKGLLVKLDQVLGSMSPIVLLLNQKHLQSEMDDAHNFRRLANPFFHKPIIRSLVPISFLLGSYLVICRKWSAAIYFY